MSTDRTEIILPYGEAGGAPLLHGQKGAYHRTGASELSGQNL